MFRITAIVQEKALQATQVGIFQLNVLLGRIVLNQVAFRMGFDLLAVDSRFFRHSEYLPGGYVREIANLVDLDIGFACESYGKVTCTPSLT